MESWDILVLPLVIVALLAVLLTSILLIEIAAAFLPGKVSTPAPRPARIAALVPAHDEAAGIGPTLADLQSQLSEHDRLIVVADNCTDATAAVAARVGAEVIERIDPQRRGKGYALDFGVNHLRGDPPDIVIVVDADCRLAPGTVATLAASALESGRPVQARYDFERPLAARGLAMVTFATRVKNHLRPLGLHRLGLPCQLLGTGMGFPWHVISSCKLATGEIVEDLVLGLELAVAGTPPRYCPEARVTSPLPMSEEGRETQRTRWETGHLRTIAGRLPAMVMTAARSGRGRAAVLALDAAVPPLAFLAAALALLVLVSAVVALLGGSSLPLTLTSAAILALTTAVLLAWLRVGRDLLTLPQLLAAPAYVLAKIALYGQVLLGKKASWVRSKRD